MDRAFVAGSLGWKMACVLVVDEQESARDLLRRILAFEGHEVRTAPDAIAALKLLQTASMDLLVTGSDANGMERMRTILQSHPDLPVILLPGNPDPKAASQAVRIAAPPKEGRKRPESAQGKEVEAQLRRCQDRLRSLTSELTLTEERERRRIAGAFHDQVGGNLALALIRLAQMKGRCGAGAVEGIYEETVDLIKNAIRSGHSLILDLSPPVLYDFGLEAALKALLENVRKYGLADEYSDDGSEKPLAEEMKILLYQSARELLVNVVKHAKAGRVKLDISRKSDQVVLAVEDDGVGFNGALVDEDEPGKGGFGLFNIRQRMRPMGGELSIQSRPGHGTRCILTAPCSQGLPSGQGTKE